MSCLHFQIPQALFRDRNRIGTWIDYWRAVCRDVLCIRPTARPGPNKEVIRIDPGLTRNAAQGSGGYLEVFRDGRGS